MCNVRVLCEGCVNVVLCEGSPQLNAEKLKPRSAKFHVRYKKMRFNPLNYLCLLIRFFKPLNPLNR